MPSCYICYAWEDDIEYKRKVEELADDLENSGFDVFFDMKCNSSYGDDITIFLNRIFEVDYIFVLGTPEFSRKIKLEKTKVSSEWEKILKRIERNRTEAKNVIIPILFKGNEQSSFPMQIQGILYLDFINKSYKSELSNLIYRITETDITHLHATDKVYMKMLSTFKKAKEEYG